MPKDNTTSLDNSEFTLTEVVFPYQVNHLGSLFGGHALQWMDQAAWICATRFSRKTVVTIASDRVEFKKPVREGTIVQLKSRVLKVGNTSVTVGVEMHAEHPLSGERFLATRGQFIMVAVDADGRPTAIRS